ncbi:MAG: YeeE/YedE family protein, partial [Pseudomonadota bacterium]
LGCTVGQAMTGVSTLAVGSLLTFGAIIAGAVFGVRALEYQLTKEAEAA